MAKISQRLFRHLANKTAPQIVCFEGDGSIQMNLQELQTLVNYKLPQIFQTLGPVLVEVMLDPFEVLGPRAASKRLPNGQIAALRKNIPVMSDLADGEHPSPVYHDIIKGIFSRIKQLTPPSGEAVSL